MKTDNFFFHGSPLNEKEKLPATNLIGSRTTGTQFDNTWKILVPCSQLTLKQSKQSLLISTFDRRTVHCNSKHKFR